MAEMAAKAHEISLEAGSKMASAMRDVIGAAAGISAFAIESARDLVNYMVRRGQMSQEEATKLLKEVEEAHATRPKMEPPKRAEAAVKVESKPSKAAEPKAAEPKAAEPKPAAKAKDASPIVEKAAPPKAVAKAPGKAAPAKPVAHTKAPEKGKPAPKAAAKSHAKPTAKKASPKKK